MRKALRHLIRCDLKNKFWDSLVDFKISVRLFDLPVCTKLVGFPIIDRSILNRWWRRLPGLCCCWKQQENHWIHTSPVEAIFLLALFLTNDGILMTLFKLFEVEEVISLLRFFSCWLIALEDVNECEFCGVFCLLSDNYLLASRLHKSVNYKFNSFNWNIFFKVGWPEMNFELQFLLWFLHLLY